MYLASPTHSLFSIVTFQCFTQRLRSAIITHALDKKCDIKIGKTSTCSIEMDNIDFLLLLHLYKTLIKRLKLMSDIDFCINQSLSELLNSPFSLFLSLTHTPHSIKKRI